MREGGGGEPGRLNGAGISKYQGARNRAHDCQGVESRWPLAFLKKSTRHQYRKSDDAKMWRRTWGGRVRDTETRRDLQRANPPGADKDLSAGQESHRGGSMAQETAAGAGMQRGVQGRAA